MRTYDDSVKLQVLDMDLESDYSYRKLSDEQIINRRWRKTEQALRKAQPLIYKAYRQLGDELLSMLKDIGFTYEKLNSMVSPKVRQYVTDRIEEWSDLGLNTGYLNYLISTHTWTYKSVLKLLIFGLYARKFRRIRRISNDVFKISAVDAYTQSVSDRQADGFALLTLGAILSFALMPILQTTYIEYLDGVILSQTEEMESFLIVQSQHIEIDPNAMKIIIIRQSNRILKVNKDKYSGGLDDATRSVSNTAYTYDSDQQVRFVAELDEKTTAMCRSLNGQIFNVNGENVFRRYSHANGGVIEVRCKGLVLGLNMPPISDHFHWCRSTLTYQV